MEDINVKNDTFWRKLCHLKLKNTTRCKIKNQGHKKVIIFSTFSHLDKN
jgi:hypothetical protein